MYHACLYVSKTKGGMSVSTAAKEQKTRVNKHTASPGWIKIPRYEDHSWRKGNWSGCRNSHSFQENFTTLLNQMDTHWKMAGYSSELPTKRLLGVLGSTLTWLGLFLRIPTYIISWLQREMFPGPAYPVLSRAKGGMSWCGAIDTKCSIVAGETTINELSVVRSGDHNVLNAISHDFKLWGSLKTDMSRRVHHDHISSPSCLDHQLLESRACLVVLENWVRYSLLLPLEVLCDKFILSPF